MSETVLDGHNNFLELTADIISAYAANNAVGINAMQTLIASVHAALAGLGLPASKEPDRKPAVPVRSSIKPDYIVCLEDGVKLKMLKRHLMTHHGLTPEAYRLRWNLPVDYPMVSPNYSATRKALAISNGLGRKKFVDSPLETAASSSATRSQVAVASLTKKEPVESPRREKLGVFTKRK